MARILVTVMPFAGHVNPISGVVSELIADGHDVAVHTGARYIERMESLGARPIPWQSATDFDEHDLPAAFPEVGHRGPRGLLANVEHVFIGTGAGQARDLLAARAATPFDVIAGDVMSVGAGLAAEVSGPPWATLSIVPLSMPSRNLPPSSLPPLRPRRSVRVRRPPRPRRLEACHPAVVAERGRRAGTSGGAGDAGHLQCRSARPGAARSRGAGRSGCAGDRDDRGGAELNEPVPANARVADRLDFDDLLPHVDLMITNGGWGGVLEALPGASR